MGAGLRKRLFLMSRFSSWRIFFLKIVETNKCLSSTCIFKSPRLVIDNLDYQRREERVTVSGSRLYLITVQGRWSLYSRTGSEFSRVDSLNVLHSKIVEELLLGIQEVCDSL